MLKIALSHDIDRVDKTYQYFTKSLAHLIKLNAKGLTGQIRSIGKKKPYWTFDEFIEIEKRYNVRSTVFFLNESIKLNPFDLESYKLSLGRYKILDPRIVGVINYLDQNGWEIGVHGSFNSFKNFELLKEEKETLEKIVGHPISGIRQHYLNLNEHTWQFQQKAGFLYDSSWGYTRDIGFKEDKYLPFHPLDNHFKVIPLTIMDTCFMARPDRWVRYEKLLDQCEEKEAIMVINFHQHVFSRYDFPGYLETYVELIERAIRRDAKFVTLSEI
ncbi:MAG TPA: polysaccharide deacetylase family protein [Bacteroidales bacterium]|nr:polysaccharide deacetylase family protein [Bacteroidales bacterium]